MSRNRSKQLSGQLHFNDSSPAAVYGTPWYDKLFKIRPIIDAICEKCKSLYNPGKIISIDEAMVKFKGRSSIKQYQPLIPIKRGFKVCCRANSTNGYIRNFVVYTEKSDDSPTTNLGHKVVMAVCRDIFNKGYQLYRNILLQVFIWLEHGTTIVGTTRHNRIGFPKDIVNKGAVDRYTRGMSVSTIIDDKIHCFDLLKISQYLLRQSLGIIRILQFQGG